MFTEIVKKLDSALLASVDSSDDADGRSGNAGRYGNRIGGRTEFAHKGRGYVTENSVVAYPDSPYRTSESRSAPSAWRTCGRVSSGRSETCRQASSAHFSGSLLKGVPVQESHTKKKYALSPVPSPWLMTYGGSKRRATTPVSSKSSLRAHSEKDSPVSSLPAGTDQFPSNQPVFDLLSMRTCPLSLSNRNTCSQTTNFAVMGIGNETMTP